MTTPLEVSDILKMVADVHDRVYAKPVTGMLWQWTPDVIFVYTGQRWVQLIDPD